MSSTTKTFVASLLIVLAGTIAWLIAFRSSQQSATTDFCHQCNLVLVSLQSNRADHMSAYGYAKDTTPNLRAFAQDASMFTNYITTGYLTPISEMSMQTGRYPFGNGVVNFDSYLREDTTTLAEILQAAGYRTGAFGSSPEYRDYRALEANSRRGFDEYHVAEHKDGKAPSRSDVPIEDAEAWLSQDSSKPFFLWMPLGTGHWPYGNGEPRLFSDPSYDGFFARLTLSNKTLTRIWNGVFYPLSFAKIAEWDQIREYDYYAPVAKAIDEELKTYAPKEKTTLTEADWSYIIGRYDDGIHLTDRYIGELLQNIKDKNLEDDTVVVIAGAHGEEFGEHGFVGHYDATDIVARGPLMIRVPGVRSRTVDSIVSSVDILPTILSVLGLPAVRRDGVSIVPLLTGATTSIRTAAFTVRTPLFETFFTTEHGDRFDALRKEDRTEHFHDTAIRTDEWRLVHRMSIDALSRYSWWSYLTGEPATANEFSLYHISEDPLEKYDVLDKYPSIASELKARLLAWEKETEDTHATLKQFTGSHQDYF